MRNRDYQIVFISLCILHLSALCAGRPPRKRALSEVQLMHNVGEHKLMLERQEWLKMRLEGIHTAADQGGSGREAPRTRRRLRPEELHDLTPEEIQYALSFLEKLMKSKQS